MNDEKIVDEFLQYWRRMMIGTSNDSIIKKCFESAISMMTPSQLEYLKRAITVHEIVVLDDIWYSIVD